MRKLPSAPQKSRFLSQIHIDSLEFINKTSIDCKYTLKRVFCIVN